MKKLYIKTKISKAGKPYTALFLSKDGKEILLTFDYKVITRFVGQSNISDLVDGKEVIIMEVNN